VLRYANRISSDAHKEVMRRVRPGMDEFQCERWGASGGYNCSWAHPRYPASSCTTRTTTAGAATRRTRASAARASTAPPCTTVMPGSPTPRRSTTATCGAAGRGGRHPP
jgi:hypothetical protein